MNFGKKRTLVIPGLYWSLLCLLIGINLFLSFSYRMISIGIIDNILILMIWLFGVIFALLLYQLIQSFLSDKAALSRETIFLGFCILFINFIFTISVMGFYME